MRIGDGSTAEQLMKIISANGEWELGSNNNGNGTNSNQFYIWESSFRFTIQKGTGRVGIGTTSPGSNLDVNGNVNIRNGLSVKAEEDDASGLIELYDNDSSNKLTLKAPATIDSNYILTLPTTDGDSGQVLSTDGSGGLSWIASGGGNIFKTIAVSGQSDVVADSSTDTLTLVGGSNMTITTNAGADTITFTSTDTNTTYSQEFVDSSDDIILRLSPSSGSNDDVKFKAGSNITLTHDDASNITIASSTDLKSNGGLVTELNKLAVDLGASSITGVLGVSDGGTGITQFGSGVATFLGAPSSSNLRSAITDETGSGSLVFANSPTLVTPALGTPASGVLTNCTGTASNLTAGAVTNGVYTTGDQTIAGNKTLTGKTFIKGGSASITGGSHLFEVGSNSGHIEPIAIFKSNGDCSVRIEGNGGESYLSIANQHTINDSGKHWAFGVDDDKNLRINYTTAGGMYASNATKNAILFQTDGNVYFDEKVGINTTSPSFPLDIDDSVSNSSSAGNYAAFFSSSSHSHGYDLPINDSLSIKVSADILCSELIIRSDSRIKKNIVDVPDNLALEMVKNIPCRYYEYIDQSVKGNSTVIGFIAQEVREVFPLATTITTDVIPDEMRILENITWNDTTATTDLQDVSGVKYKFYVTNDLNDLSNVKKIYVTGNEDNTFTFEEKYNHIFCYGKEVNDFHSLHKQKLFTLNFSATQELIRKVEQLETENVSLTSKVASLESQMIEVLNRLQSLETK